MWSAYPSNVEKIAYALFFIKSKDEEKISEKNPTITVKEPTTLIEDSKQTDEKQENIDLEKEEKKVKNVKKDKKTEVKPKECTNCGAEYSAAMMDLVKEPDINLFCEFCGFQIK